MIRRAIPWAALVFLVSAVAAEPACAEAVDVEIVLAVDSSGSIDRREFQLQREGYIRALTDPKVLDAIGRGKLGAIAITLFEWSGPGFVNEIVPWTRIAGEGEARQTAAVIAAEPRQIFGGGTAVGAAIHHATTLFGRGYEGTRRVIDVSGDGMNNRGPPAELARNAAVAAGITINGLPIEGEEANIAAYYRENVIGGPGAFLIVARNFDDFARAIRDKLIKEIQISEARPH
jgi:hypothetical protein